MTEEPSESTAFVASKAQISDPSQDGRDVNSPQRRETPGPMTSMGPVEATAAKSGVARVIRETVG